MRIFGTRPKGILNSIIPLLLFVAKVRGQAISGTVVSDQRIPLPNVNVSIPALRLRTGTNDQGGYKFTKLPSGFYTVEFYSIGYEKETRTALVSTGAIVLDVVLRASPLEMPAVTVTAKPEATEILNSSQPVAVLEGRELDRERGQSVGGSLENLPGVSTFSRGPLSAKPVIRGLTSQRVVITQNGMRHDSQQWDDEQSPELDALNVERIEVLRGPNSVLYGSDALGGVVNVITLDPHTLGDGHSRLAGNFLLNGFSNNRQGSGSVMLFGTGDALEYLGQFSARHSDDIMTPAGALENSGASEVNGSGMIRTSQDWGTLSLDYSHFGQEIHISPDPREMEDEPDLAPQQNISHDRIHGLITAPVSSARLEVNGAWQKSERSEFEDEDQAEADSAVVKLRLSTFTVDAKVHHAPVGDLHGTVGASIMSQKNETLGLEPLIPGFTQTNFAGYVYEELQLSPISISGGLRFDSRKLEVEENDDLEIDAETREYTAVTGTAGLIWHAAPDLSFGFNVGRGWRAPIAEELFINGTDEGSIRFKIGNPDLEPEESVNLDLSARLTSARIVAEASVFHNRINKYIFLSPTPGIDSATGFTKYVQNQANATLTGFEANVHLAASDNVVLLAGFDFVLGRNEETDSWLPMIPAHRFRTGLKLTEPACGAVHRPYISIDAKVALDQERIDAFETGTGGYSLFDFGIGGEIALGSSRMNVDFSVHNLFDRAYFDHLSRYKDYGLNPGRDVTVKVAIPFILVH